MAVLYKLDDWLAHGVVAGFTDREGGVSKSPYESLNLGMHVGDSKEDVLSNRAIIAKTIDLVPQHFVFAKQVHGNMAWHVSKKEAGRGAFSMDDAIEDADALVTMEKGVPLMILSADCAPVLFAGKDQKVVGAAHAGWRGATSGIITSTTTMMVDLGVSPEALQVAIGPTIRGCCYEVDEPVAEAVRETYRRLSVHQGEALTPSVKKPGHFMLDIPTLIREELLSLGITSEHVHDTGICTHCDERFFSHRRENGRTGRQGAYIYLK